jgi:hypothetical protein
MKNAYDKVTDIKNEHFKPSNNTSKLGYDNPPMLDAIVDKHFEKKELDSLKFRKTDWSKQDIPHTVPDEIHQEYYTSPVKNSHQYPNELKIRPLTLSAEIPPKSRSLQQKIEDDEPMYIGMKRYTRKTLPNKITPIRK